MRTDHRIAAVVLVTLLLFPLSGCLFSREIANTRRNIERAYPDLRLERQIVLNLGPMSLRTLRWIAGMVSGEEVEMAARYLRDVSRVKVGVYRSENPFALDAFDVSRVRFDEGWKAAVKTQDDDSRVWVLYRDEGDTVRDLYVVVLDDEDLAIARVRGNVGRLLTRVMKDHVDLPALLRDGTF